jgi:cytochrome c biogenesis protein CcmG, thiol:disulfide interchange protein DsbE
MSAKTFVAVMAVLAIVALLGFGLLSKGEAAIAVGDPAPDGDLEELAAADGADRIADYRGGWLLINFWASWCDPCREEAPALEGFWRDHRDQGVIVLGVNLDDTSDDARAFIDEYGLSYPQLRDGDGRQWRDDYGMTGFPESFLVDPEGELAVIRRGPVDAEVLDTEFAPAIEGSQPQGGSS